MEQAATKTGAGRIEACYAALRAEGRAGLVAYLPVGYPSLAETPGLVDAVIRGGAAIVELGVPFSDPLADGATIQRATVRALEQGVSLGDCLRVASGVRSRWTDTPLLLMGYYNSFLNYDLSRFSRDAADAGVDGVIVVDLPPEEATPFLIEARKHGLALVFLLAPTSTEERIRKVAQEARGFIYCVSIAGVTGARTSVPEHLEGFLGRIRACSPLPLAVGFGISRPEHVREISRIADAAVVGSALVDAIDAAPPGGRAEALQAAVAALAAATLRGGKP